MSEIIKSAAFILASIFLARFALPANITPIIAMAVFLPFITQNKHLQTLLPIGILFLTDIFLGFYGSTMFFVYGTLLLISILSRKGYNRRLTGILKTSGFSVLLWHIIVNFGVYLNGLGTISLAQTYIDLPAPWHSPLPSPPTCSNLPTPACTLELAFPVAAL